MIKLRSPYSFVCPHRASNSTVPWVEFLGLINYLKILPYACNTIHRKFASVIVRLNVSNYNLNQLCKLNELKESCSEPSIIYFNFSDWTHKKIELFEQHKKKNVSIQNHCNFSVIYFVDMGSILLAVSPYQTSHTGYSMDLDVNRIGWWSKKVSTQLFAFLQCMSMGLIKSSLKNESK